MCSLTFLRSPNSFSKKDIEQANFFSRFRGPDNTNIINFTDDKNFHITLIHNLLDISGTFSIQPRAIYDSLGHIIGYLIFNGEIYNFDNDSFKSDTEYLGSKFFNLQTHNFDGEFAIVYYDLLNTTLHVFTDPFLTKPLYFGNTHNNGFGVSSYASTLKSLDFSNIELFEPNSYYQIIFIDDNATVNKIDSLYDFDLNQNIKNFDIWESKFIDSVKKRGQHGNITPYVNLSSGYDSGAICLALNLLKIPYYTLSITAGESYDILKRRHFLNKQSSCLNYWQYQGLTKKQISSYKNDINHFVEPFTYVHEDAPSVYNTLQNDSGAVGLAFLANEAKIKGFKVSLSGAGADEITSDYGFNGNKIYFHSEFGGKFPKNLHEIFPWKKFYGDTQRSYLFKEEFILGRYSIEGRYPFLDANVVQAFLSLDYEFKNSEYKAPISHFLKKYNYPFEKNNKRGFTAQRDRLKKRLLKLIFD